MKWKIQNVIDKEKFCIRLIEDRSLDLLNVQKINDGLLLCYFILYDNLIFCQGKVVDNIERNWLIGKECFCNRVVNILLIYIV